MVQISLKDRKRLSDELNSLPAWALGGVVGERAVLMAAGLPADWIMGHPLTGTPIIDSQLVISNLEHLGHLEKLRTHYALGALAEYLLNASPHIEGKLFLAQLIIHYGLISDPAINNGIAQKYGVLSVPAKGVVTDLDWPGIDPTFSWEGPTDENELEGSWSKRALSLETVFLEKGARTARAVCRVETPSNMGTGFLVGQNLVLTNHHVIPLDSEAAETRVRFGYRIDISGQLQPGEIHNVSRILRRSGTTGLDYAVFELDSSPGADEEIGYLKPKAKPLTAGQSAFVIQHPHGNYQKVVLQDNWITYVAQDNRRFQYLTNTERGSSGSPVCDANWDVIGLHHSRSPLPPLPASSNIRGNEGIPMMAILPEIFRIFFHIPEQ